MDRQSTTGAPGQPLNSVEKEDSEKRCEGGRPRHLNRLPLRYDDSDRSKPRPGVLSMNGLDVKSESGLSPLRTPEAPVCGPIGVTLLSTVRESLPLHSLTQVSVLSVTVSREKEGLGVEDPGCSAETTCIGIPETPH